MSDAWLDAGDASLRHQVQFLADAGVIDIPLTQWPIPSTDIVHALSLILDRSSLNAGQAGALQEVERRVGILTRDPIRVNAYAYVSAEPAQVRSFEDIPREAAGVGASLSLATTHVSARLAVSYVEDPDDDKDLRLDGTYGTLRLGNWLLTAGALERWWGPGWDGSLILSSNARPVPALSVDREVSTPFKHPWLAWIGPWRFSSFMGQMEEDREDRDYPLLFGMRATLRPFANVRIADFRPFAGLEFAFERTAQWCAEGLPCGSEAFWNLLSGNDNAGENVDPQDEPGNQLGGWALRWPSPVGSGPYAVYWQKTGESFSNEFPPRQRRSLELLGLEAWGHFDSGATWRINLEYAGTECGDLDAGTESHFDCAYNSGLFAVEGYRYRGRTIGHSIDGDGRLYSLTARLSTPRLVHYTIRTRFMEINRGGSIPDTRHTISSEPIDVWNIEGQISLMTARATLNIGVGADRADILSSGQGESQIRGFVDWRIRF